MKKTLFFLFASIIIAPLFSQVWGQTNVFPDSGDVGIGTTQPGALLDVRQENNIQTEGQVRIEQKSPSSGNESRLYLKADTRLFSEGGASIQAQHNSGNSNLVLNPNGGRTGVGPAVNGLEGTFHVMENDNDMDTMVLDVLTHEENPNLVFSKLSRQAANIRLIGIHRPEELQFQISRDWGNINMRTTLAMLKGGNIQVGQDNGTAGFSDGEFKPSARGILYGDAGAVFDNNNSGLNISGRGKLRFWVNERTSNAREAMTIHENGDISSRFNLLINKTTAKTIEITGGSDLAEPFDVINEGSIIPGLVVAIDAENPGQLKLADKAYDHTVAGIISGAGGVHPGMIMSKKDSNLDGAFPVALTGRVYCWVDATKHPVVPGDLLTTSDLKGFAMKAVDYEKAKGAIIGKAMSKLDEEKGLVLVLVSLQ